jgi:hypothetical protein
MQQFIDSLLDFSLLDFGGGVAAWKRERERRFVNENKGWKLYGK